MFKLVTFSALALSANDCGHALNWLFALCCLALYGSHRRLSRKVDAVADRVERVGNAVEFPEGDGWGGDGGAVIAGTVRPPRGGDGAAALDGPPHYSNAYRRQHRTGQAHGRPPA